MSHKRIIKKHMRAGEQFAGLVQGIAGEPDYYLFLVQEEAERVSWAGAMAWAERQGACLPNLREQALLLAALPDAFSKRRRYWSCQSFTPASSHACGRHPKLGDQFIFHKSYRGSARAVRRISIKSTSTGPTCQ